MEIVIPRTFITRWQKFFATTLVQFIGYDNFVSAPPIAQAIVSIASLLIAFGIVWLIGWLIVKFIKVVF